MRNFCIDFLYFFRTPSHFVTAPLLKGLKKLNLNLFKLSLFCYPRLYIHIARAIKATCHRISTIAPNFLGQSPETIWPMSSPIAMIWLKNHTIIKIQKTQFHPSAAAIISPINVIKVILSSCFA